MNEFSKPEMQEMKPQPLENFKSIKPEKEMSSKKMDGFIKNEFNNIHNNTEVYSKSESQDIADIKKIPCRNEDLAGKKHPETGVPFERKIIDVNGEKLSVVVPEFDSPFETKLAEDKLTAPDLEQFKECNANLKEAIHNDESLKEKFTDEQLEQIENGDTPDGYTWHHDAEVGKMQLVDTETHQKTGHTGGRAIWGGGSDAR